MEEWWRGMVVVRGESVVGEGNGVQGVCHRGGAVR